MENQIQVFSLKAALAWLGSLWLGIPEASRLLAALMIADYLTGILAAARRGELCSEVGFKGVMTKVATMIMVWASHQMSAMMNVQLGFQYDFGSWVAIAFSLNEFISIMENCDRCGVVIPKWIVRVCKKIGNTIDDAGPGGSRDLGPHS